MLKINLITGKLDLVRDMSDDPNNNKSAVAASTKATKTLADNLALEVGAREDTDQAVSAIVNEKKEYRAKLTQTSTGAPSAVVIKDTIPTPTLARTDVGIYTITKAGAFTANKTMPDKLEFMYDVAGNYITIERTSADVITIKTYTAANNAVLGDGILSNQLIIIEIYA